MALTLLEPIIVNTAANFTFANASVTSNITAGNVKTDNLLYANGSPYVFTTSAGGSNTQVQFNDANVFSGSANFTFNKTSNTLTVTNIVANGAGLTALNGSNVTGAVAYATTANSVAGANVSGQVANALVAGTVYTNAQPNITSVGLLTTLSVGPNSSITLTGTSGFIKANSIQGTDGVNAVYPGYNGVSGAVGVTSNLTVGISSAGNITANGNVTANYFVGNGSALTSISGTNVTGEVAYAATANLVWVGNVSGLGNIATISLDSNASNVLYGNGVFAAVSGGGGASISNGNSNVNIATANGNVTIGVAGNANIVTVTGTGVNISGTLNATSDLTAGNITVGSSSITGANLVSANYFTGTLTTAAQPNITSLGSLSSLTVSGTAAFIGLSTFLATRDRFSYITSASGTTTHDLSNGAVFYHLLPGGSFTPNFTNVDTTNSYNTVAVLLIEQGATPYVPGSTITINSGTSLAVRWIGGSAPTGTASGYDMVSYSLIRNLGNWVILGQYAAFS